MRGETGSERVFASGSSLRGGLGSKSTISRNATGKGSSTVSRTQSSGRTTAGRTAVSRGTATGTSGPEKVAAGRTSVTRTVPASRGTATSTSSGSSSKVATARKAPASGTVSNHRKPAITNIPGRTTTNATQGTDRYNVNTGASSRSTSSYERGSSSSSSPSYNRSSSSTSGRSGFSGGSSSGYSRGSSGSSSGGYSRSGSSVATLNNYKLEHQELREALSKNKGADVLQELVNEGIKAAKGYWVEEETTTYGRDEDGNVVVKGVVKNKKWIPANPVLHKFYALNFGKAEGLVNDPLEYDLRKAKAEFEEEQAKLKNWDINN